MHYHGTPISPRAQLERMAGRMFCVSYAVPQDLATCLRIGQSVMLDNGAFSAKTRGREFDRDGFYRWIEPILSHPHWAVVPDVIDGTRMSWLYGYAIRRDDDGSESFCFAHCLTRHDCRPTHLVLVS